MSDMVSFVETTSEKYNELKDSTGVNAGTLYFTTDDHKIHKGEDSYSQQTAISKDSTAVQASVGNINFMGEGFLVEKDVDNPDRVNISMPFNLAKMNSSYMCQSAGTTNPTIADIQLNNTVGTANTYQNRLVALPNGSDYSVGDWASVTNRAVLNKGVTSIKYTTTDFFWIPSANTTFRITLTKGDGSQVVENTDKVTGNGTLTTTNCSVVISNFTEDFMGNKAKATFNVNVAAMLGGAGRFSIKLSHVISGVEYSKVQNNLFYDDNPAAGTIASTAMAINTVVEKYLSGVKYIGPKSKFDLTMNTIDGVFNKSFVSAVGNVKCDALGINVTYTADDVATAAGGALGTIKSNASAVSLTKTAEVVANKYVASTVSATASCGNGWNTSNSVTNNVLILTDPVDSYPAASTSLKDEFQDENYRLKSTLDAWNNKAELGATDLKCGKGTWLFPADTSTSQVYYRNFAPSNNATSATSNFIFTFAGTGLTEANLSAGKFLLEISLNGTDWFTFAKNQEVPMVGGSGCRVQNDTYKLNGTSGSLMASLAAGTYTSATSGKAGQINGYGIYARITINGSGIEVNSVSVSMS